MQQEKQSDLKLQYHRKPTSSWNKSRVGIVASLSTKLLFAVVLSSLISTKTLAEIPTDKAAHFGAAFTGQVVCEAVANQMTEKKWARSLGCFAIINTLGAVKEAIDPSTGGHREWRDLAANAAGSAFAIPILQFGF